LTYLPEKHLDAFVKMNEEKWPTGEIAEHEARGEVVDLARAAIVPL
jgi:hypothetical protein